VVFNLDRLSGDDIGLTKMVRDCWHGGQEVHSTNHFKIDDDTKLSQLATFARFEIKMNSIRMVSKQRAIAEAGYKLGRPLLGYRWVELKRVTDDEGREHIKSDHGRTEPDQPAWDVRRQVFLRLPWQWHSPKRWMCTPTPTAWS
jgi:DNA invertase Pin-like site-specific DNA recombinase